MNNKEKRLNIIKLHDDREKRLNNLIGKYVITCKGNKSNETIYLQSKKISNNIWWTKFLANAKYFETKECAEKILETLRYNNPEILLISESHIDKWKNYYWEKFLKDMKWE